MEQERMVIKLRPGEESQGRRWGDQPAQVLPTDRGVSRKEACNKSHLGVGSPWRGLIETTLCRNGGHTWSHCAVCWNLNDSHQEGSDLKDPAVPYDNGQRDALRGAV